mmetsp:Transcript_25061/g.41954  ORF Transcript_25061/g.41954 Transcript_25061/m.41954 type:complete len:208 (+) Transcript_25061:226-849(+)
MSATSMELLLSCMMRLSTPLEPSSVRYCKPGAVVVSMLKAVAAWRAPCSVCTSFSSPPTNNSASCLGLSTCCGPMSFKTVGSCASSSMMWPITPDAPNRVHRTPDHTIGTHSSGMVSGSSPKSGRVTTEENWGAIQLVSMVARDTLCGGGDSSSAMAASVFIRASNAAASSYLAVITVEEVSLRHATVLRTIGGGRAASTACLLRTT